MAILNENAGSIKFHFLRFKSSFQALNILLDIYLSFNMFSLSPGWSCSQPKKHDDNVFDELME